MKNGDLYKLDSYDVKQYENERIVDVVQVIEEPKLKSKYVLVYSGKLKANVLVPKKDLMETI
jgi:hypothetical protein